MNSLDKIRKSMLDIFKVNKQEKKQPLRYRFDQGFFKSIVKMFRKTNQ